MALIASLTAVAVVVLSPVCATAESLTWTPFTRITRTLSPGLSVPAVIVIVPVAAVPPAVPPVIRNLALARPSNQSAIRFGGVTLELF